MARTIQIQRSITYKDGQDNLPGVPTFLDTITQTTPRQVIIPKTVTTTEVSVSLSTAGITTNGEVMIRNLSTTNYIEWGTTTTDYCGKIKAGRTAGPLQLNAGKTLYLKANTASCEVEIYAWDD